MSEFECGPGLADVFALPLSMDRMSEFECGAELANALALLLSMDTPQDKKVAAPCFQQMVSRVVPKCRQKKVLLALFGCSSSLAAPLCPRMS